jgi:hypothetical protein
MDRVADQGAVGLGLIRDRRLTFRGKSGSPKIPEERRERRFALLGIQQRFR